MSHRTLPAGVHAALEFGPIIGFVVAYLLLRDRVFVMGGAEYSGLVAVIAIFTPVFVIATGALWWLTGRVARIQIATAILVVVFGGLTVWLNDPTVFKMKPTVIYLTLGLILWVGLLRGQSWLGYILEDMIPLKPKGWMILTKRVIALCLLAAAANELVWRTQSERVWVLFETIAMPVIVVIFCLSQIGLVVDYATFKTSGKKR